MDDSDSNISSPDHWNQFYEHLSTEVSDWEQVTWRMAADHGLNLYVDYDMECHL